MSTPDSDKDSAADDDVDEEVANGSGQLPMHSQKHEVVAAAAEAAGSRFHDSAAEPPRADSPQAFYDLLPHEDGVEAATVDPTSSHAGVRGNL